MRRSKCLALAVAAAVATGCGTPSATPTDPSEPPGGQPPGGGLLLARGSLTLPAALDDGDTGQHEVFVLDHRLPGELFPTSGGRLVVSLRDASRPGLRCPDDEPESGCATVDWSGEPGRPRVPSDGRFVNRVDVVLDTGSRTYFFSRTLRLADVLDLIDPERRHTAIGGAEVRWDAVLPTDLVEGSRLRLRLVLTKWLLPDVRIDYEIRIVTRG